MQTPHARILPTVMVAALGYFVDIYDLILFLVVRMTSLRGIGVPAAELLDRGVFLLDVQMVGMLLGGILFGVLGDRRGRLSVLFGSIFLYSVANVANGFVTTLSQYAVLRFLAGVGLAGELGAGVTLVTEIMSREGRGWGTTVIAGVGVSGAVVAALVGRLFSWQVAYFVGGGLGLSLLVLRIGLRESKMFETARERSAERGNFFHLFRTTERCVRYLRCIAIGLPIWFCVGILVAFSPELSGALGLTVKPDPGQAVLWFYVGGAVGDFASGFLSQSLRSRKKIVAVFLGITALAMGTYFATAGTSIPLLYASCVALGTGTGYWAVFVTMAAEQFGTNLRATATTTAPNFVRGALVPMTVAFQAARGVVGVVWAALGVGVSALVLAGFALRPMAETFGRDLDFVEE